MFGKWGDNCCSFKSKMFHLSFLICCGFFLPIMHPGFQWVTCNSTPSLWSLAAVGGTEYVLRWKKLSEKSQHVTPHLCILIHNSYILKQFLDLVNPSWAFFTLLDAPLLASCFNNMLIIHHELCTIFPSFVIPHQFKLNVFLHFTAYCTHALIGKISVSTFDLLFRIVVVLKTKTAAGNQMLSRWYCMVDQSLVVHFCIQYSINFDKIFNTNGWIAVPLYLKDTGWLLLWWEISNLD